MANEHRPDSDAMAEVVNPSPNFGSPLLTDEFAGQDDAKALDPLDLESAEVSSDQGARKAAAGEGGNGGIPQLQNPEGATQMFNLVGGGGGGGGGGAGGGGEKRGEAERQAGRAGMRVMAGEVTVGAESAGVTDWHTGTDGGKSTKPQVGVPYGSFAGV